MGGTPTKRGGDITSLAMLKGGGGDWHNTN